MKKLKGWNDFFILLIVALGIIVSFLLIGSFVGPITTGNIEEITVLNFGKLGIVTNIASKIVEVPDFVSGELQAETLKTIPQLEFKSSVFGSHKEGFDIDIPEWLMDDMNNIRMTAHVDTSSNRVGDFAVRWNGKEIYKGKPEDELDVYVDKQYIKQSNTVELYADSPGVAFWAENYYFLKDIEIKLEYGPAKIIPLILEPSDIEKFEHADLRFYATSAVSVVVKVNGKTIYEKVPRGVDVAKFTLADAPLRSGPNLVSVNSDRPLKMRDVELKLFLVSDEVSKKRDFDVSAKAFNSLRLGLRGRIDAQVTNIERQGSLELKLNEKKLPLGIVKEGVNTVYFSMNDVQIGSNTLELSATGSFDVQKVIVGIER
ncbi:MAG: hypothetical protein ISS36_00750 [Candidatus Aenigmarchaeota archaeon]|nr:hypothetical protein [Candidatus Aenigmarchaeota archaeon]